WVTKEQQEELRGKSLDVAKDARQLIKDGKMKDAASLLDKAIADNPQNAAAFYLRGVMFYRQEQLVPARKAFDAVAALLPDHAPTLNNLGVVEWRQNAAVGALNQYDKAMVAAPASRVILDN